MITRTATQQEEAEDIFFGQIVIVLARWFFLSAIMILALTATKDVNETSTVTLLVVALMAINFFIHGRYVMERPANRLLLMVAGVLDLLIISFFVLAWDWRGNQGLNSEFYIFYYPMVFAFALVFPPRATLRYALLAIGLYLGACVLGLLLPGGWPVQAARPWPQPGFTETLALLLPGGWLAPAGVAIFKIVVSRLVTLAAMGGLGTFYWRIQRQRRRQAAALPPQLKNLPQAGRRSS
jgi:hypothetical protein